MRTSFEPVRRLVRRLWRAARRGGPDKAGHELDYWRRRRDWEKGRLGDAAYERYYTTVFGLDRAFYSGKWVLDIGCGPRGSLNWAEMASERVGLDPLADDYRREFGVDTHAMTYVAAPAERMPFEDASFDIVTTFNSLDHVDNVDAVASEILRVLRPDGTLLIITEVNHDARPTEPQAFSFEVLRLFAPPLLVIDERRLAMTSEGVYPAVDAAVPWDEKAPPHEALLVARLHKPVAGRG